MIFVIFLCNFCHYIPLFIFLCLSLCPYISFQVNRTVSDFIGLSILIKQVIVYLSVCLFICSAMGGLTTSPNGLKYGVQM